jgi:hypothetical protein
MLTSLLRRKLLPQDEEWEQQVRNTVPEIDVEKEEEFVEWCQNRFLEILDQREYTKGTKTREEKDEQGEAESEAEEEEGEEEGKVRGIGLGAAFKYLAQGLEPTKPPITGQQSVR